MNIEQNSNEYQLFFSSDRYDYCITYTQTWFEIVATHRQSGRSSHINTLNYILSAFDIDSESENAENPDWNGTQEQVQTWVQTAQQLFGDSLFLQSLEKALDEDRKEGEWEKS
jgi:enolase